MRKHNFGKAFNDQFQKVSSGKPGRYRGSDISSNWQETMMGDFSSKEGNNLLSVWRRLFLSIVLIIIFAVFFVRLFHLQVVEGSSNRASADSNRFQVKVIHAPRGVIYDRNGQILAQNEPGFRLVESSGSGTKVTDVSRDDALKMEVDGDGRYKNLEIDHIRSYPFSEKTAHILGYLSEITEDEIKQPEFADYRLGDKIGRGGIEQAYEKTLKGQDGGEIIEVDAAGNKIRTLRETAAIPGQNIYLTIDASLQNVAYDSLKKAIDGVKSCCGAAVLEDPNNGQILAMVSIPSFDPKNLGPALTNPNAPLLNRAIGGTYPPGSTFKIATSLAGLQSGKITPSTTFEDTGIVHLGTFTFANWYFTQQGKKEGAVDLVKALQRSNDTYYYNLGQLTGEDPIAKISRELGLGSTLGVDIPGESSGVIPDNDWKEKNMGQIWYPGDTLHMSIGQGFVLSTPLQINHLVSTIASSGTQHLPHLALKISSSSNKVIKQFNFDPITKNEFKPEDIATIKKGLELVPKFGGTAWPFFSFPVPTAGKTGTAEFGDPKNETHAWYTAYAPVDKPQIAATALIEAGGEGSTVASPVVKDIFRWYFSPNKNDLIKDISAVATDSAKALGE